MKHTLLLLFFLPCIAFGQWTNTYGGSDTDIGYDGQQTNDGGYIITGQTYSFGSLQGDVWLIKTDSLGDSLWSKTFDDNIVGNSGKSVQQTTDGGYIIAGNKGNFSNANGWLIKTDSQGDTMWTKIQEDGAFHSVQQTSDGGYIVTGTHTAKLFLARVNSSGAFVWSKTYNLSPYGHCGYSVQQTADGYIIVGYAGIYHFTGQQSDLYLVKTDVMGNLVWEKTYGGSGQGQDDWGKSVQQTTDGGYIITGYTKSFGGYGQVWLLKTDNQGDTLWTKTFGGNKDDGGLSVQQTIDGGYIVSGFKESETIGQWIMLGSGQSGDLWVIKTDSVGDTLWTKTYGGTGGDRGYFVQQTSDNGYVVGGDMGYSNSNVCLIKIEPEESTTNPTSILQRSTLDKHLLNIYDLLGRPSLPVPNQILLYKYSDGSVEKRLQLDK